MAALTAMRSRNAGMSLHAKHAVVVGGTSGIGHGIALRLAEAVVPHRLQTGIPDVAEREVDILTLLRAVGAESAHAAVLTVGASCANCECLVVRVAAVAAVVTHAGRPAPVVALVRTDAGRSFGRRRWRRW